MQGRETEMRRKRKMERLALIKQRHRKITREYREPVEVEAQDSFAHDFDFDFDIDIR